MCDYLKTAKQTLTDVFPKLQKLYPGIRKVPNPYIVNGRIIIQINYDDGRPRKCTAYARVLLEVKLGRILIGDETCDHIDGNSLNDSLDNLQMLSLKDNVSKGPSELVAKQNALRCSIRMTGVSQPQIYGSKNGMSVLVEDQVKEIKIAQKKNYRGQDKVLAEKYNVSRGTISQIRRGIIWKHIVI